MSKVTYKNDHGKIILTNKLTYPEAVNERAYKELTSNRMEGFLPVNVKQGRKSVVVECRIESMITLEKYFEGVVSKRKFLDTVYQIVMIIKNCEDTPFNPNNLELGLDRIFVDKYRERVYCLCWPIVNNQNEKPPKEFFRTLPDKLQFNPREEKSYVKRYRAFFDGYDPFSLKGFERLLNELMGIPEETVTLVGSGPLVAQESIDRFQVNDKPAAGIEYDPCSASYPQPQPQPLNRDVYQTGPGSASSRSNSAFIRPDSNFIRTGAGTSQPSSDMMDRLRGTMRGAMAAVQKPSVVRRSNGETYMIDKDPFWIGIENTCDVFIVDNIYVSRRHAQIVRENGKYYLIDNNSTNFTYLNGVRLQPMVSQELFDGAVIRVANEYFLFRLN